MINELMELDRGRSAPINSWGRFFESLMDLVRESKFKITQVTLVIGKLGFLLKGLPTHPQTHTYIWELFSSFFKTFSKKSMAFLSSYRLTPGANPTIVSYNASVVKFTTQ
jgi:hypothetical protein